MPMIFVLGERWSISFATSVPEMPFNAMSIKRRLLFLVSLQHSWRASVEIVEPHMSQDLFALIVIRRSVEMMYSSAHLSLSITPTRIMVSSLKNYLWKGKMPELHSNGFWALPRKSWLAYLPPSCFERKYIHSAIAKASSYKSPA